MVTVSSGVGRFLAGIRQNQQSPSGLYRAMAPARREFRTGKHSTSTLDEP
jgi:hypothetical protein